MSYDAFLEIIADNPAATADELTEIATDSGFDEEGARENLSRALDRGDVMEADSKYWIVRKGKFGFHEYDHPTE